MNGYHSEALQLVAPARYRCGDAEVYTACRIVTLRGKELRLRPKTFDVLVYLIEHRDQIVSKSEFLNELWKDAAVSDNSPAQCVIELRKALGDDARNPRYIKTVPKLGYQFVGAVAEIAQEEPPPAQIPAELLVESKAQPAKSASRRWLQMSGLAALALIVFLGFLPWMRSRPDSTLPQIPGKTAVAVMFFENQTQTADLDWMREGLADMLITTLARSPKLNLLSRQQLSLILSRSDRKSPTDLEEAFAVARRAHAAKFILGSFADMGGQMRICAQLHDGRDGRLIAAESVLFQTPSQTLAQIDTLARELAADLGTPLEAPARMENGELGTNNLEAYRYYSRGVEQAHAYHEDEAVALFRKALTLDPNFAMAQARIGYTLAVTASRIAEGRPYLEKAFARSGNLTVSDRRRIAAWYTIASLDFPQAIERYRDLLASDPSDSETYLRLGQLLRGEERTEEAIEILKQGLAGDPDSTALLNLLGTIYSLAGHHAEAIAMEQKQVALVPAEANAEDSLALAYHWAGRFDDAEQAYKRALALKPDFELAARHLAALYLHTGRYRAALQLIDHQNEISSPGFIKERIEEWTAIVHAGIGDMSGALKLAEDSHNLETLTEVRIRMGDYYGAEEAFAGIRDRGYSSRGKRLAVQRTQIYLKGELALLENRPSEAISYLKESLRHPPEWSDTLWLEDSVGNAFLTLDRYDEAVTEYQRAIKLYPGLAMAHYHLAIAARRTGRLNLARSEYQKFLDLWWQADPGLAEPMSARADLANLNQISKLFEDFSRPSAYTR